MKVQILMSTMNKSKISDLDLNNRNIFSDILIINQTNDESVQEERNNIRMISVLGKGTSPSRNRALGESSGDICIWADDDIVYVKDYKEIVLSAFEKYKDADVITFQIKHPDDTPFKSNYMQKHRKHTLRTSLKCASIEIAFKREAVLNKNIKIDPEFGLGARYRIHDDVIFIADAVKAGLKVYYEPIPIVIHPKESSGTIYNDFLVTSKGAAFYRIFGNAGYLVDIAFALMKYKDYKSKYSISKFIKLILSGTTEYKKTH